MHIDDKSMTEKLMTDGHSGNMLVSLSGWWCNNHLEKYEFVNGKDWKDYPIYEMENKIHV